MRIAVAQIPTQESVQRNATAAAALLAEAHHRRADLVLLPELFLSGYHLRALAEEPQCWAVTIDDDRLEPVADAVRETGVTVAMGAALQEPARTLLNALLWFRADGTVEHVYSKVHLWSGERGIFRPGDRQAIVRFGGLQLGVGICYDAGFPEFTRSYARLGVDGMLFASAFAQGSERHRYSIYHPARALENGIFIAVANSIGDVDGTQFFGHSQIFDQQGRNLVDLDDTDQLGIAELPGDPQELVPYLTDLRPNNFEPELFEG